MKLFVLGATGKTGAHLIPQALERGHEITAFVRSPDKLGGARSRLAVVVGDPTHADALATALAGHDAVLSVIGSHTLGRTTIHADCARATVEAMGKAGVRRLVAVSSAFTFDDVGILGGLLRATVFRHIAADHREMERILHASALDWTVLRPPRLVQGDSLGQYRSEDEALPEGGSTLRFSDVAHSMLTCAEKAEHIRHDVGICY